MNMSDIKKPCYKCGNIYPLEKFYKDKTKKQGHGTICKTCSNAHGKSAEGKKILQRYRDSEKGKLRTKHYNALPHIRKARAEWEKTEKGKMAIKKYRSSEKYIKQTTHRILKDRFGITLAQYDEMLKCQDYGCDICGGINNNGKRLSVDHNHSTGKVRGLLCHKCNVSLGLLEENIDILKGCIEYIQKHG